MKTTNQNIKPLTTKRNELGNLEIGGCDLVNLAKEYGTPLYVMDKTSLITIANEYKEAFSKYQGEIRMKFASKALTTSCIIKILSDEGFGFDAVSMGEIFIIKNAGVDMSKVIFNGNNKTKEEIELALESNIGRFSVDNFLELELLNEACEKINKKQKVLLRITPGIECHTHEYIQTGHLDSKFGFDMTQIDEIIELIQNKYKNLDIAGLHAHIGSQIFETLIFKDEIEVLIKEIRRIKDKYNIDLNEINIGGGVGIKYVDSDCPPSIYDVANVIINAIEENCKKYDIEKPILCIEPGRSIVGVSGVTLYTIGSSKQVPNGKKYISVDGGMSDNIRHALYQAEYTAEIANKKDSEMLEKVTIAGKHCESGDILIENIELPKPTPGDVLCVYSTGAYNYSMSSNYNSVLKPAMVLVNNSQSAIIIKRETYKQLIENDVIL